MPATVAPEVDLDELHPNRVAAQVDDLDLRGLVRLAGRLLAALETVAEGPGARLAPDVLAHAKPGTAAPTSSPRCRCGCPSLRDHARGQLARAWEHDAAHGGDPHRLRGAVLRAAVDLHGARHRPDPASAPSGREDTSERDQRIVSDYDHLPPATAAQLETARAGHCTAAAIRSTRRRNSLHPDTGAPVEPREVQRAEALVIVMSGRSQAQAARDLGVAPSTVSRWVRGTPGADR